jgi:FAD/FMN-containing dehydrogenase
MTAIHEIRDGAVRCDPGVLMGDLDATTREAVGQELRLHPSTRETATIGGFLAGGSGGVGSIRWGMLADPGNVLGVKLATLEAVPRLITLDGPDALQALHAYGTTGIIAEVTMPLAPAPDWVEMLVAFEDWTACLEAGHHLGGIASFWLKELGAVQAPAPHAYFLRHRAFLNAGDHVLCVMVAPVSADAFAAEAAQVGGRIAFRSDTATAEESKGLPHMHHLVWNHTTLRALRVDPEITYLQMGFPERAEIAACAEIARRFEGEIVNHVEFTAGRGALRMSALPLVRFSTPERLVALMAELEAMDCPVWDPHSYTLEEGGRRGADPAQRAAKAERDPKGLLNPGKMIAWEEPGYERDPARRYAWPGTQPRPADVPSPEAVE